MESRVELWTPESYSRQKITSLSSPRDGPLKPLAAVWNAKFTKSALHKACIMCGAAEDVEMHHVRKIRDLRNPNSGKDFFTRQMQAINRKQVPLCNDHHIRLHLKEWTPEEMARYPEAMRAYRAAPRKTKAGKDSRAESDG